MQRELERERDSVKDIMFSLSDISYCKLFNKSCKKKQTLSHLVGTTGYVIIRAKFVTSLSRYLLAFFKHFNPFSASQLSTANFFLYNTYKI